MRREDFDIGQSRKSQMDARLSPEVGLELCSVRFMQAFTL